VGAAAWSRPCVSWRRRSGTRRRPRGCRSSPAATYPHRLGCTVSGRKPDRAILMRNPGSRAPSCHTAIAEAAQHLQDGYGRVVDIDLDRFLLTHSRAQTISSTYDDEAGGAYARTDLMHPVDTQLMPQPDGLRRPVLALPLVLRRRGQPKRISLLRVGRIRRSPSAVPEHAPVPTAYHPAVGPCSR
jgi:hypothetical protein